MLCAVTATGCSGAISNRTTSVAAVGGLRLIGACSITIDGMLVGPIMIIRILVVILIVSRLLVLVVSRLLVASSIGAVVVSVSMSISASLVRWIRMKVGWLVQLRHCGRHLD